MKIDFPTLEAFVSVAEFGSFTRAAQHLNLSQTAVTHRIIKLERNLGAKLLQRSTRDVRLTRAGSEFLPKLKAILGDLNGELLRLRIEAAAIEVPLLSIACLPTIAMQLLPNAIEAFNLRNPTVAVRVFDTSAAEIAPLVTQGTAEFGLTIVAAGNEELSTEPLFTEDYLLVCPAGHPLGNRREIRWSDIGNEKLIRVSPQTANRFIVDQALGGESEEKNWMYEVQHTLTALRLVRAGVGLTVMPRCAVEALNDGEISYSPLTRPKVTRTIGILSRRAVPLSMLAQSFRACLLSTSLATTRVRSNRRLSRDQKPVQVARRR
jgi:DNA-binding transcriptional LysR family regulator